MQVIQAARAVVPKIAPSTRSRDLLKLLLTSKVSTLLYVKNKIFLKYLANPIPRVVHQYSFIVRSYYRKYRWT